jgi:hypothetical protein
MSDHSNGFMKVGIDILTKVANPLFLGWDHCTCLYSFPRFFIVMHHDWKDVSLEL